MRRVPVTLGDHAKREAAKALEAEIAKGVQKFMSLHGWRHYRMTSGLFTAPSGYKVTVGEPGIPDLLFVRYVRADNNKPTGVAYLLWVETKRAKGGKKAEAQAEWHVGEERLGGLIYTCNDVGDFREWYYRRWGFLHKGENLFLSAGVGL